MRWIIFLKAMATLRLCIKVLVAQTTNFVKVFILQERFSFL